MNSTRHISTPATNPETAPAALDDGTASPSGTNASAEAPCRKTAAIICFTEAGFQTACAIAASLPQGWRGGITRGFGAGKVKLADWTAQQPTALLAPS